jgi:lipopolysaccharide export system protein LptA
MKLIRFLLYIMLIQIGLFGQTQNDMIVVTGDSLVGKFIDGESIREVYGNVVLTQGDVRITCNTAIQFLGRNDAELIGNVIATQDTLTIKTEKGYYYGNLRMSRSTSGVTLDDKKVILTADSGLYYFNEDRAFFQSNVTLYDTTTTLTSDELTYFKQRDHSIAIGNVKIVDAENIIEADSLEHFRKTEITYANSNVKITNIKNSTSIYGGHLEDYRQRKYTLIKIDPVLMQIDSTISIDEDSLEVINIDTLLINSLTMESFRDTADIFIATDSVKIIRGEFASDNDKTIYLRSEEKIITNKLGPDARQPILWYENSQLTGDSIIIHLEDNNITMLEVEGNAFLLSQNENIKTRFDQSTGSKVLIYFIDNKINRTEFYGTVYSIYNMFEEEEPNGLTKSNSHSAVVYFEDNQVSEVRLYGQPVSEYYPEPQVIGNERSFLLPRFSFIETRPVKGQLLRSIKSFNNVIEQKEDYGNNPSQ